MNEQERIDAPIGRSLRSQDLFLVYFQIIGTRRQFPDTVVKRERSVKGHR